MFGLRSLRLQIRDDGSHAYSAPSAGPAGFQSGSRRQTSSWSAAMTRCRMRRTSAPCRFRRRVRTASQTTMTAPRMITYSRILMTALSPNLSTGESACRAWITWRYSIKLSPDRRYGSDDDYIHEDLLFLTALSPNLSTQSRARAVRVDHLALSSHYCRL